MPTHASSVAVTVPCWLGTARFGLHSHNNNNSSKRNSKLTLLVSGLNVGVGENGTGGGGAGTVWDKLNMKHASVQFSIHMYKSFIPPFTT